MDDKEPQEGSKTLALVIPAIALIIVCLLILADQYIQK